MGKKKDLEDILNKLNKQTLVSILTEYAEKDPRINDELFLRFEKQGDSLGYARNIIQSSINAVERRGFVEYGDVFRAVNGAETVLEMVIDRLGAGDNLAAISLSIVILEEMMDLIEYSDDSSGTIGEVIEMALEKIGEASDASQSNPNDSIQIFDRVFSHAQDKRYDGWTGWRMDLLSALLPLCGDRANRSKMEQYLAKEQNILTNDWSSSYERQQLQNLQHQILLRLDGKAAADSYMELRLDNSDFRDAVIKEAIADKLYEKALSLCLEGEQENTSYPGLVRKWKELRYAIYEKTKDKQAQKILGMELLQSDFNYYSKLKALYAKKNGRTYSRVFWKNCGTIAVAVFMLKC